MDTILNHSENVNAGSKPVQDCTVEGSSFTCNNGESQWRIRVEKCACHSSWCPACWHVWGLRHFRGRLSTFNWRRVRHIVLSANPDLFHDGKEAYEYIMHKRGIGELLRNLERVAGVKMIDWVVIQEWYANGFPHWHVLIEVDKEGSTGMIGKAVIKHFWPFGIYVHETYIESERHWKNELGYFQRHGYFGGGKGHQTQLPEWALNGNRHVRRWFGKKKPKNGKKESSTMGCGKRSGEGKGCRKRDKQRREARSYKVRLEACGQKTKILIWEGEKKYYGTFEYECRYRDACEFVKSEFDWEWVDGESLECKVTGKERIRYMLNGLSRLAGGQRNLSEGSRGDVTVGGSETDQQPLPLKGIGMWPKAEGPSGAGSLSGAIFKGAA